MVAGELWASVLGYNLVRKVMAQAAVLANLLPRQISLPGALQPVREYWQVLSAGQAGVPAEAGQRLLAALAKKRVGKRPGRQEPRAIKRRPPNRPLLRVPRAEAKRLLAKGPKAAQAQTISQRRRR
jgi:hypothetical protein